MGAGPMSNRRKLRRKGGLVGSRKLAYVERCGGCGARVDDTGTVLVMACECGWRVESSACQRCLDTRLEEALEHLLMVMTDSHLPYCDGEREGRTPPSLTAVRDRTAR